MMRHMRHVLAEKLQRFETLDRALNPSKGIIGINYKNSLAGADLDWQLHHAANSGDIVIVLGLKDDGCLRTAGRNSQRGLFC